MVSIALFIAAAQFRVAAVALKCKENVLVV